MNLCLAIFQSMHIVHHIILSFLGMADIVRLSFTSKSCRQSCVSISSLNFDALKLQYPTLRGFQDQLMNINLRKVPIFSQREEAVSALCTFQVHLRIVRKVLVLSRCCIWRLGVMLRFIENSLPICLHISF
ncbi:hypothetical protein ACJW30_01G203600 [Castanea mollissima]